MEGRAHWAVPHKKGIIMAANTVQFSVVLYDELLSKFPIEYQAKLRRYTGQELYYIYKLCTYKPRLNRDGYVPPTSLKFLSLKAKVYRWLRGQEKYPPHPNLLHKACSAWSPGMVQWLEEQKEELVA